MDSKPTVLMIPCFAGAPWQLDQLQHLHEWPMDRLIGEYAAQSMLGSIKQSLEIVLSRTGHLFRFSHPGRYSEGVRTFLQSTVPAIGGVQ